MRLAQHHQMVKIGSRALRYFQDRRLCHLHGTIRRWKCAARPGGYFQDRWKGTASPGVYSREPANVV